MVCGKGRRLPKRTVSVVWLTCWLLSQVVSGNVDWFLHLSDLHLSQLSPGRGPDLQRLLKDCLSDFQFSSVLVTGDLVEGKRNKWRAAQIEYEWNEYRSFIATAVTSLGITNETFVDIRGNHDTFDVPVRDGDRDWYTTYGGQGKNWHRRKVLVHSFKGDACPPYVFVGVDLSPDVGLRSPVNFFGRVTDDIVQELESSIVTAQRELFGHDCDPVFLAYGHYPLSMTAKASYFVATVHDGLKQTLLKYGIDAWLCGHLHSVFGTHLHRLHHGHASTVLELETMDWKLERRFRIVAIDDRRLSFADLQFRNQSSESQSIEAVHSDLAIDGAVVLITAPASPYFSPLGNRPFIDGPVNEIRALVWPIQTDRDDFNVSAEVYCDASVEYIIRLMPADEAFLYKGTPENALNDDLCPGSDLTVRAKAVIEGTEHVSYSERRRIRSRQKALEYPHSLLETLALGYQWSTVLQNVSVSLLLAHIIFLFLFPRTLDYFNVFQRRHKSLDEETEAIQSRMQKCLSVLLAPLRAWISVTRYSIFWWGQLCFVLLLTFGPWFFARVLSDKPLGIIFLSYVSARPDGDHQFLFAPELSMRVIFYYIVVIFPMTLWMVWTIHRYSEKRNGLGKRHKLLMLGYMLTGLCCCASWAHTAYGTWQYYGPSAFFLSPGLLGLILLNLLTCIAIARFSIPKCRQE